MENKFLNFFKGIIIAGCLCFFACRGIDSISLIVLLLMIMTNILLINKKEEIYIYI